MPHMIRVLHDGGQAPPRLCIPYPDKATTGGSCHSRAAVDLSPSHMNRGALMTACEYYEALASNWIPDACREVIACGSEHDRPV